MIKPGIPAAIGSVRRRRRACAGRSPRACSWCSRSCSTRGSAATPRRSSPTAWCARAASSTSRIVPGVIRWILEIFAELIELLDRALYRVDEWLRFKAGQSRLTLVLKGALGTVWSVVAYFLRLYINLFIEPAVNPIKHFPVVTVAAKLMLPFYRAAPRRAPRPGRAADRHGARHVVRRVHRVRHPRPRRLPRLGAQGELEAVPQHPPQDAARGLDRPPRRDRWSGFLKPGFHSGTIPKRFTKLRRAAWKADERGVAQPPRASCTTSRTRSTSSPTASWSRCSTRRARSGVTDVAVSARRARLEPRADRARVRRACRPSRARIAFEQQSGWMVASIPERGWIDRARRRASAGSSRSRSPGSTSAPASIWSASSSSRRSPATTRRRPTTSPTRASSCGPATATRPRRSTTCARR